MRLAKPIAERTEIGVRLDRLDEKMVEHHVVKHECCSRPTQAFQEPEVVRVVAEVDHRYLVRRRFSSAWNQFHPAVEKPYIRGGPTGRLDDPDPCTGPQGRQELHRVIAHSGADRRQRRRPQDLHSSTLTGNSRLSRAFSASRWDDRSRKNGNSYYEVVSLLRFLAVVLYIGYLVNVGLLFVVMPWSQVWGLLLTMFPTGMAAFFGLPWVRGVLSAFGVLHLLLVVWELVQPTLLTPLGSSGSGSQDLPGS